MGTEAFWIPALMAAVGTGASAYNTKKTADKQDNNLARQLQSQGVAQREADAKTAQLIQQRAGSTDADERAGSLGTFMKNIQAQRAAATSGLKQAGAVSDAYTASAADASLGIGQYGAQVSDLMSRIDAPGRQRLNESNDNLRFEQDLNQIKRRSAGDDFLSQMRYRGIRRNPWIDLGAGFASGAGGAMSGSGSGRGAGNVSTFGNNLDNFTASGWID